MRGGGFERRGGCSFAGAALNAGGRPATPWSLPSRSRAVGLGLSCASKQSHKAAPSVPCDPPSPGCSAFQPTPTPALRLGCLEHAAWHAGVTHTRCEFGTATLARISGVQASWQQPRAPYTVLRAVCVGSARCAQDPLLGLAIQLLPKNVKGRGPALDRLYDHAPHRVRAGQRLQRAPRGCVAGVGRGRKL